jgi:hypothetical protein
MRSKERGYPLTKVHGATNHKATILNMTAMKTYEIQPFGALKCAEMASDCHIVYMLKTWKDSDSRTISSPCGHSGRCKSW